MNDPRESLPWAFGGINIPLERLFQDEYSDQTHIDCQYRFGQMIKDRFQVICFSGARQNGWDNEMMWAHYGADQGGVCLEFDEDIFLQTIQETCPTKTHFLKEVQYTSQQLEQPFIYWNCKEADEQNFSNNLLKMCDRMIFHKSHFWEKEDEKRLVIFHPENLFIPIHPPLRAIHVGLRFPKAYLPSLKFLLQDHDIMLYDMVYQKDRYERWPSK
ncbi:DUF2971 domain-containing protein [Pontibacter sp. MBLB2868]|uniref:DUF2971 domain-containing protein n=1 Tax=Pontibacter sp. MBLB2868 TaxID=3451555 RepID=UPI003F74E599